MRIFIIVLVLVVILRVLAKLFPRWLSIGSYSLGSSKSTNRELSSWQRQVHTVVTFAKISVRRYFRDKVAIFFTVAFPLIFLFVFGSLNGGNNSVSFNVALINQSHSQFASNFDQQLHSNKMFKISQTINNLAQAKDKMSKSEVDATIVLPPDFGAAKDGTNPAGQAVIYYDENNAQVAQTLKSVLQGIFQGINAKYVKVKEPFSVASKSTSTQGLSKMDYTVSGLLGFSIIGLGIFGPINYFPEMKKQGVLRRLHITPLRVWQFFVSSVLSNAVIGLFSIAIMLTVARLVFNFHMVGDYLELAIFIIFGILTIFGIGLAIGGWAKNENQAAPLANIIVFPMMFLSGTFFPRYAMPQWLQHVSAYLPLTPIIDGIRMIATEGEHLTDIGPQIGLTAVWAIIIYAIAFRVFRWE